MFRSYHKPAILQVLPSLESGGVERTTCEIAQAIVDAGMEAYVASAGGQLVETVEECGATHITLPLASKNPVTLYRNRARIEEVIEEHTISLVHARSRAPAWSAYYAAKQCKVPFITTFHGTYGTKGIGKKRYNSIMLKGQRVIANSNYIKQHILDNYTVDPQHIRVIPRCVDIRQFDPSNVTNEQVNAFKDAHMIPSDMPVIMLPGRITEWKGHALLIEALVALKEESWVCIFVGDDKDHHAYRARLEEMIIRHDLIDRILFTGHSHHMQVAYTVADIVISASTNPEAFGRVAVEAQAMGKPVIATAHGGALETIIDGRTGWLVEVGDNTTEQLSHEIQQVLHLPQEEKEKLAYRAIDHVRREFSLRHMQQRTLDLYEEVLGAYRHGNS